VPISFPRHFVLLACAAILQLTVFGPRDWNLGLPLVLPGALHALALVAALRGWRAPLRRVLFLACAALLASASFYLGLWLNARLDRLWRLSLYDRATYARIAVLISAPGALGYAFLVRAFWVPQLRRLDALVIAGACTTVTIVGAATLELKDAWLIVLWWFTFSAALYWSCRERATADERLPEHRA
jgi:hypothetical protein